MAGLVEKTSRVAHSGFPCSHFYKNQYLIPCQYLNLSEHHCSPASFVYIYIRQWNNILLIQEHKSNPQASLYISKSSCCFSPWSEEISNYLSHQRSGRQNSTIHFALEHFILSNLSFMCKQALVVFIAQLLHHGSVGVSLHRLGR